MATSVSNPPVSRVDRIDPRALMRIKSLEMRARMIVEGFMSGMHRSPYHGFSVEFTEYRQYTAGDDPRYIDWKLYARSDRFHIKRFEDETNLRCWLLVDNSKSMQFGSITEPAVAGSIPSAAAHSPSTPARGSLPAPSQNIWKKSDYAATLAATFAYFLSTQHDAAGLVTFDEVIREYLPARYRPGHLRRLMIALDQPSAGIATSLTAPLRRIADLVTKRGMHVLISDLLAPLDGLETHLGYLRSRGHEVMVFHILDPAELTLSFDTPAMFEDVESGKELYIDPQLIREEYTAKMQAHLAAVAAICDGHGIDYHRFTTDQPLELAMFDFFCARMQMKRPTMRHGGGAKTPSRKGGAGVNDNGKPAAAAKKQGSAEVQAPPYRDGASRDGASRDARRPA